MSGPKWAVRLSCDHWIRDLTEQQALNALAAEVLPCRVCSTASAPTGDIKRGGKSANQTRQMLERGAAATEEQASFRAENPPTWRSDGLVIRPTAPNVWRWWCHHCDGKKPPKEMVGIQSSRDDVLTQWDLHRRSTRHARSTTYTRNSMALAAERVNRHRKPTPPGT